MPDSLCAAQSPGLLGIRCGWPSDTGNMVGQGPRAKLATTSAQEKQGGDAARWRPQRWTAAAGHAGRPEPRSAGVAEVPRGRLDPAGLGRAASRRGGARPWAGAGSVRGPRAERPPRYHGSALTGLRDTSNRSESDCSRPWLGCDTTDPTSAPRPWSPPQTLLPFPPTHGHAPVSGTDLAICTRPRDAGLWAMPSCGRGVP